MCYTNKLALPYSNKEYNNISVKLLHYIVFIALHQSDLSETK